MTTDTAYVAAFGVGTITGLLALLGIATRLRRGPGPKNAAHRLFEVGEVLAVFLLGTSVVKSCVTGESLAHDLAWTATFGVAGLVLVELTALLGMRTLLGGKLGEELGRGNPSAGLAGGAHVVATGLIAASAFGGTDTQALGLGLTFFVLGLLTHVAFVSAFRALTTYDDAEQILGGNVAAALSYAGVSVAVAVMIARAVHGEFTGWTDSLVGYGGVVLSALALYPSRQLLVQGLLLGARPTLRGGALDRAIAVDHDLGHAALESVTYLATALAIAGLA